MKRILILALLVALAGCQTPAASLKTGDGSYRVAWHPAGEETIAANAYFDLEVRVTPRGDASPPAAFTFDATMPAHRHGMNVIVSAEPVGDATWIVRDVLLHMPGEWALDFDVTDDNGVVHRAREILVVQ